MDDVETEKEANTQKKPAMKKKPAPKKKPTTKKKPTPKQKKVVKKTSKESEAETSSSHTEESSEEDSDVTMDDSNVVLNGIKPTKNRSVAKNTRKKQRTKAPPPASSNVVSIDSDNGSVSDISEVGMSSVTSNAFELPKPSPKKHIAQPTPPVSSNHEDPSAHKPTRAPTPPSVKTKSTSQIPPPKRTKCGPSSAKKPTTSPMVAREAVPQLQLMRSNTQEEVVECLQAVEQQQSLQKAILAAGFAGVNAQLQDIYRCMGGEADKKVA